MVATQTRRLSSLRNATVFVIGGGHSLRGFDFTMLRGHGYILSINEAAKEIPFSDGVFSADIGWINKNVEFLKTFKNDKFFAVSEDVEVPDCTLFKPVYMQPFFSNDPECLHIQGHSGFAVLNMLYHARVKNIFLLGYDYLPGHFHDGYTFDDSNLQALNGLYTKWARAVDECAFLFDAQKIKVFKLNTRTRIRNYQSVDLRELFS